MKQPSLASASTTGSTGTPRRSAIWARSRGGPQLEGEVGLCRADPSLELLDAACRPDHPAVVAEVLPQLPTDRRRRIRHEVVARAHVVAAGRLRQRQRGDLAQVIEWHAAGAVPRRLRVRVVEVHLDHGVQQLTAFVLTGAGLCRLGTARVCEPLAHRTRRRRVVCGCFSGKAVISHTDLVGLRGRLSGCECRWVRAPGSSSGRSASTRCASPHNGASSPDSEDLRRASAEGCTHWRRRSPYNVHGARTSKNQAAPAVVPWFGVVTSCHPAPCLTDHAVATWLLSWSAVLRLPGRVCSSSVPDGVLVMRSRRAPLSVARRQTRSSQVSNGRIWVPSVA